MKIIVAVDSKWGIGREGKLLFSVPEDMRHFRAQTLGKVVAVGRKTLDSFPGGRPLKGRTNVVLSRTAEVEGATVCRDLPSFLRVLGHFSPDDVFICGGESVYRATLPYADEAIVTKIFADGAADAHFPNLDEDPEWEEVSRTEEKESNGYRFVIVNYRKKPH